jgi:hypothetical protein
VVNGGLIIKTTHMHDTLERMTLKPAAICRLAEIGVFIDVSVAQIADVQNIDVLGRAVAVWQLTWLIITVLGRQARHLPISLLELNTVVNIAFAICLPLVWWHNAGNVSHPLVVLEDEQYQGIVAVMLMAAETTKHTAREDESASYKLRGLAEFDYLCLADQPSTSRPLSSQRIDTAALPCILSSGEEITRLRVNQSTSNIPFTPYCAVFTSTAYIKISSKDLHRWSLASSALRDPPRFGITRATGYFQAHSTANHFRNCLIHRAPNSTAFELDSMTRLEVDGRIIFYITLALALHGAFHLTAWNWVFPTVVEKLLWRISSFGLIIGFLPLVLASIFFRQTTMVDVDALRDPILRRKTPDILKRGLNILERGTRSVGIVFIIIWVLFLVGCSVFLFLASFLALRRSPSGVYARLDWSSYLPSLS